MTDHVELYDNNCDYLSGHKVIKLTKFVYIFYKKNIAFL